MTRQHRNLTDLCIDVLAVHRLTRLATADEITQGPRDRIIEWAYDRARRRSYAVTLHEAQSVDLSQPGGWQDVVTHDSAPPKLATLVTCRWCASVWLAAFVVVVGDSRWWRRGAVALAMSSASTLVAGMEE